MGYESRVIVYDRAECTYTNGGTFIFANEVARFNLACMGRVGEVWFSDLFTTPVDFNMYVREDPIVDTDEARDDEWYRTDCYGAHCCYTDDFDKVIAWLEKAERREHYRRAALFLGFLRTLKKCEGDFDHIVLVHYGY